MAVLPKSEYGMTSAATVARDMLRSFLKIHFGLIVGIGGGAPSAKHNIQLGDIIISTCGSRKGGEHAFVATGSLNQPPQLLLTALSRLEAKYKLEGHQLSAHVNKVLEQRPRLQQKYSRPPPDSDRLYRPDVVHPDSSDACGDVCSDDPSCLVYRKERREQEDDPAIHYGLIASANQLMKDALARDKLAASIDVFCFEIEAAGLMNHFPYLVIRRICDYSNSHKNKEWQGFAAVMAVAYVKDLLRQIPLNKVEAEMPISEVLYSIKLTGNETKYAVISMASNHHCSTNANLARKRRHPGTRAWLLNSPAFQEWKLGSRQHLWLYGLAGCGKTILSITILNHLLQIDTYTTLAFFFDFNNTKKQKLEDLLHSLAVQLYHTGNKAARRLNNINALSACINTIIQTARKVFIIINALDKKAQLIITGRPEVEFQSEIPRPFGKRNYLLDKIQDKIGNRADRIQSSAIYLLHFLVYTKRPLILEEAIKVIATKIDREPQGFDINGRLSLKADILRYCPSLVIIAKVIKYAKTIEELYLAYFSVKEYLLNIAIAKTCLTYLTDIKGSHSMIRYNFLIARLYYAYLGRLIAAARNLIAEGADVNMQGSEYGNALQAALFRGN
ncbi:uncharacterized protein BKA55DRAFT_600384 [Fusarium redolens]|uniref:Nephrocystin 3-like N-terminal domain-containing protein n=1 Tax=Fusarium redolens TaxID=48865 RepID=A0A9P9FWC9_FUSRE|nr:uncharacterized protein BKA55DRAFT_600384 [Fusarium redolens]KAH7205170.1 hypothetical protein BKA55DRAFT_600384 [Fusarium redolens]